MAQPGGFSIDPALLPSLNYTGPAQDKQQQHGPITSGLVRGVLDNLGGIGGAAVADVGRLTGSQGVEDAGNAIAQYTQSALPSFSRPDLDVAPWQQGGAHVAPWLEYQAAKQVPLMGAYMLGGRGLAKAGIEAPEFLQNIGARVPRVLGGGGLRAGMDEAAQAGAREAGKSFAQTALGAEVVGLPIAAGSMYQEAQNKPGGATYGDAVKAAVLSPFYSALDAIEPAEVAGLAKRGLAGGLLKRVATAGIVGSASEVVQEGIQTAMEQSFRTDLTPQQKMSNIVNAAVTGGAIGGLFGGGASALGGNHDGSLRAVKEVNPSELGTDDLKGVIDQVLALPAPQQPVQGDNFTMPQPFEQGASFDAAQPAPRPFENTSPDELAAGLAAARKRVEAGTADDGVKQFIEAAHAELQARNVSARNDGVNTPTETVEPVAGVPGGTSSAPVSTLDLKELFKGVAPAARKAYAGATTLDDIAKINNSLLEAGTAAKGHLLIAERLGVNLNEPAAPVEAAKSRVQDQAQQTPLVTDATSTTTAPAAPANLEGGDLSAPAKLSDRQLLQALGKNNPKEVDADIPALVAAKLTDTDPQFNLKGRIDDPVQQEAVRRGLLEPVLSETGKPTHIFDYSDKARELMKPEDRPIPHAETQKTLETLGNTERQGTTENEIKAQQFNQRIDALGLTTAVHPTEVAQLKQMAANPETTPEHLDRAIKTVESGKSLFEQPPPGPNEPLKNEAITPSLYTAARQQRIAEARQRIAEQRLGKQARKVGDQQLIDAHDRLKLIRDIARRQREERAAQAASTEGNPEELTGDQTAFTQRNRYLRGGNRYLRGGNGIFSARADAVRTHVAELTKNWKSGQKVNVVESLDQLPADIRASVEKDGAHEAYGFTRNGEVYLLAHNMPNIETATAALYHEALGHLGLQSMFREHLDSALTNLYNSNAALRREVDAWRAEHQGYYRKDDVALAVEEVLAQRSENGQVQASWLSKIAAVIKAFARRAGINLKFSDNEINAILSMAHDQIVNGKPTSPSQKGLRYMMALWHGSPHDFDKFSLDHIGSGEGAQVYGHGLYFASMKDVAQNYRDALSDGPRISTEDYKQYFAPGRIVKGYSGHDKVIAFHPGSQSNPHSWSVDVQRVKSDGSPIPGEYVRNHSTRPDDAKVWDHLASDWVEQHRPDILKGENLEALKRQAKYMAMRPQNAWLDYRRELVDDREGATRRKETDLANKIQAEIDMLYKMRDWVNSKGNPGKLYNVTVKPTDDQFMDWFKPLDKQSKYVQDALKTLGYGQPSASMIATLKSRGVSAAGITGLMAQHSTMAGADIYHDLRRELGGSQAASQALLDAGIRGNKYEDQFSRGKPGGTYNYVVFDDNDIEIANKYMRPAQLNERAKQAIGSITQMADDQINTDGARGKVRRVALGWAGEKAIEEHYGPGFKIAEGNGVEERRAAMNSKHAMTSRLSQPVTEVKDRADHLDRTDKKSADDLRSLLRLTEYGLNPFRKWDEQIADVKDAGNAENLKPILADAQTKVRSLTAKGHIQLYHDMRALNDIAIISQKVTALHQDVTADKLTGTNIPAFQTAPMDEFMAKAASQDMGIQQTRDFWRQTMLDRLNALDAFLGTKKTEADGMKGRDKSDVLQRADALSKTAQNLRSMLNFIGDVPNFHLGRDGDYFVDMKVRLGADGNVDPKALAAASEALEQFGTAISSEGNQDHIYIRVKDQVAQRNLVQAAYELQRRGIVRKNDVTARDAKDQGAIQFGKRSDDRVRNPAAARWLAGFIERINGDDALKAEDKKRLIEEARASALDVMPDNSLMKVMTQRRAIPGYDPDMFKNFFTRQKIAIDAHVGMAVAPKVTDAFGKMRLAVDRAQSAHINDRSINDRSAMTEVVDELSRRDRERADNQRTPVIDAVRQATNTWALGLSPAFVAMQVIQIPQLVYPRLGAKYGFVKAAKAMSGSTKQALAIMSQVFKDGYNVSASRSFDAVISLGALQRAGVSKSTAEYLMHLANTGQLDIGGPARELTRAVDGSAESPLNKVQRFASAPGYYAETFSRVLTALAHHKLNGETDAYKSAQAAAPFIEDTLWNYAQDMQGRMFGKHGMFGAYTPLATQFMTYTSQLVQRLYLDMHAAMFANDPATKAEARKFLMGHLAATTVFAGTLGLPFATLFAAAFDKLKDLADGDDEPSDIQASYRNFLADVFGKDVGEMIARGAPRGAGIDISKRVGEQDIFPFSKFLSDRRSFKDSLKDLQARGWGAPASFAAQALQGGESISDGDVIGGMTQLMPVGLGSLVKAYRMTSQGYVDAKGKQLPISTPSTNAILGQALGFAPSQMAEYGEARQDQTVRKGLIARQAGNLRGQLADAIMNQDQDGARELLSQAQKFDQTNPAFAVLPSIESTIRQRMRQRALAQVARTPLGVSAKDLAGQQATRYANIDYAAQ